MGESDLPQEEDPEVEWQDFSTEQMLSIIASRTRTQVFWMGNQMANVESLIDTTMWYCIETFDSHGPWSSILMYVCHVCSMIFLLMILSSMFRWFNTERSFLTWPRTAWRDFPLKTTRPSCGSLDGKGRGTDQRLDVRGMVVPESRVVHWVAPTFDNCLV